MLYKRGWPLVNYLLQLLCDVIISYSKKGFILNIMKNRGKKIKFWCKNWLRACLKVSLKVLSYIITEMPITGWSIRSMKSRGGNKHSCQVKIVLSSGRMAKRLVNKWISRWLKKTSQRLIRYRKKIIIIYFETYTLTKKINNKTSV